MSNNILNYDGKRINDLTLCKQLTDEALLVISKSSLTYSLNMKQIRDFFTYEEGGLQHNFLSASQIESKIDEINRTFNDYSDIIGTLQGDMKTLSTDINERMKSLESTIGDFTTITFPKFKDSIISEPDEEGNRTGYIPKMQQDIADIRTDLDDYKQTTTRDIEAMFNAEKGEIDKEILGVNASVNYIYGYGPVVPTLLPEGKIFLQTFNVKFQAKQYQYYTITLYKTEIDDEGNIINSKDENGDDIPFDVVVGIKAEGMKITRISLNFPDLPASVETIPVKVILHDDYALDKKGLKIYDGIFTYNDKYGWNNELGIFMIPTTATTINISANYSIGETQVITSFNHYDHSIWESIGGILVVPLVDDNGNFIYDEEDTYYLAAEGSSEENPKGAPNIIPNISQEG